MTYSIGYAPQTSLRRTSVGEMCGLPRFYDHFPSFTSENYASLCAREAFFVANDGGSTWGFPNRAKPSFGGSYWWWKESTPYGFDCGCCPSPAYSISLNNAKANPIFSRSCRGGKYFCQQWQKYSKTPQENCVLLTPLSVGGRLCDEFCCGDFCICYTGCFFRVKTKVVSRMGLCGIW